MKQHRQQQQHHPKQNLFLKYFHLHRRRHFSLQPEVKQQTTNDQTIPKQSNNKNNYSNGKCEYNPFASTVSFKTTVDIPYYILVHGFGQQTE